jgi:hypothetical protein
VLCWASAATASEGTFAHVDLGLADVEQGLANTQRSPGTDGENAPEICGPASDQRQARRNLGTAVPQLRLETVAGMQGVNTGKQLVIDLAEPCPWIELEVLVLGGQATVESYDTNQTLVGTAYVSPQPDLQQTVVRCGGQTAIKRVLAGAAQPNSLLLGLTARRDHVVSFRIQNLPLGALPNPTTVTQALLEAVVRAYDAAGNLSSNLMGVDWYGPNGIAAAPRLDIALSKPSQTAELTLAYSQGAPTIHVYDVQDNLLRSVVAQGPPNRVQSVTITGGAIARLVVESALGEAALLGLCLLPDQRDPPPEREAIRPFEAAALSVAALEVTPRYPAPGEQTLVVAQIENAGARPAHALLVQAWAGGTLIGGPRVSLDATVLFPKSPALPLGPWKVRAMGSYRNSMNRLRRRGRQSAPSRSVRSGLGILCALSRRAAKALHAAHCLAALLFLQGVTHGASGPLLVTHTGDSGPGSLRQAIELANLDSAQDSIRFALNGSPPYTIHLLSPLPDITQPVAIDGSTQPGYAGKPIIELEGSGVAPGSPTLLLRTHGCLIRGLVINRFYGTRAGSHIVIEGGGRHVIAGNYIGTDLTGTKALSNDFVCNEKGETRWPAAGIRISGSSENLIGGAGAGQGNLLAGCAAAISIIQGGANVIQGNLIGTDFSGTRVVGNGITYRYWGHLFYGQGTGIFVFLGTDNTIGGRSPGSGNVITGQATAVSIRSAPRTVIVGNVIGTDITGSVVLPYVSDVSSGRSGVRRDYGNGYGIDCTTEDEAILIEIGSNVISGNGTGISISGFTGNVSGVIRGNHIGTDRLGAKALPNNTGIQLGRFKRSGVVIGGDQATTADARNVISGNAEYGIMLNSPGPVEIRGNFIGTDATGRSALGNQTGIAILGNPAESNQVGGDGPGASNLISGNREYGVLILGSGASQVLGNLIGTDVTGVKALGNGQGGVVIASLPGLNKATNNVIARNVISGNGGAGVYIWGDKATNNMVQGNCIGTDQGGTVPLGNGEAGVRIYEGSGNRIGGALKGEGNRIAFNGRSGVLITYGEMNAVLGNAIYDNAGQGIDLGDDGVTLTDRIEPSVMGGNRSQNFPEIRSVRTIGAATVVEGTLRDWPNRTFRVEFFGSATADPSGYGEGAEYIGWASTTTDANGLAGFKVTLPVALPVGHVVTATATDPDGNTSEFSAVSAPTDVVWLGSFGGGDVGEGLDLEGHFLYALDIGTAGAAGQAGDAHFTPDTVPGVTINAGAEIAEWYAAEYGDSPSDAVLEFVMRSIRHTPSLTVTLERLSPGTPYKLQLLFAESCCHRGFDVWVDGRLIADDFAPYVVQGGINNTAQGAVIAHSFLASKPTLEIRLGGTPVATPEYTDHNPILNGLTLEALPAAATLRPPRITEVRVQNRVSVTFEAVAGVQYALEYQATLGEATWQSVAQEVSTGTALTLVDPVAAHATAGQGFWRVAASAFTPSPLLAQADLGPADLEQGLVNIQRAPGTDGENSPEVCGPPTDQRQARRNLGTAGVEGNDSCFYFNVLDPVVKGSTRVTVQAVVLDAPEAAGATLRLECTNAKATNALDLANVFGLHPDVVTLAGTGAWRTYAWEIHDAGFRTLMQGVADFRLSVTPPQRVCVDQVRATAVPVPVVPMALVDLAPADLAMGLANPQRAPGTDGENSPEICGPPTDQRQARRNLGPAGVEGNDSYFYFNVLDPLIKGSTHLLIKAVILDAPEATGATLRLEYTNSRATNALDVANVFAPHPAVVTLTGTGAWRTYAWEIRDAGFRTLMQGVADFRLGVSPPHRVCVDQVRVTTVPEPVVLLAGVDLAPVDLEQGLANTQRSPGTDGENTPEVCGPADDQRQTRQNLGTAGVEANDFYFYFNVLDPAVKGATHVRVEAVVLDAPEATGATLRLEYTNARAVNGLDLPNVFAPHPDLVALAGSGGWRTYAWEIDDAGFRTLMQGVADFRLGVSAPHRACVDRVSVTASPGASLASGPP